MTITTIIATVTTYTVMLPSGTKPNAANHQSMHPASKRIAKIEPTKITGARNIIKTIIENKFNFFIIRPFKENLQYSSVPYPPLDNHGAMPPLL